MKKNLNVLYKEIKEALKGGNIVEAKETYFEYKNRGGKRTVIALEVLKEKTEETEAKTETVNPVTTEESNVKEMRALIKNNAYVSSHEIGTHEYKSNLRKFIEDNKNKWVDIDTSYLFNNQYNTKEGFRIFDSQIEEIRGDIREGLFTCGYCGKQYRGQENKPCDCDYEQRIFNKENTFFLSHKLSDFKTVKIDIMQGQEKALKSYSLYSCGDYYRIRNNYKTFDFIFNMNTFEIWSHSTIGFKKVTLKGIEENDGINSDVMLKALELITIETFKQDKNKRALTIEEYNNLSNDYKGIYSDFQGIAPHLKGKRTMLVLTDKGTSLLIEGIDLLIIDNK